MDTVYTATQGEISSIAAAIRFSEAMPSSGSLMALIVFVAKHPNETLGMYERFKLDHSDSKTYKAIDDLIDSYETLMIKAKEQLD